MITDSSERKNLLQKTIENYDFLAPVALPIAADLIHSAPVMTNIYEGLGYCIGAGAYLAGETIKEGFETERNKILTLATGTLFFITATFLCGQWSGKGQKADNKDQPKIEYKTAPRNH